MKNILDNIIDEFILEHKSINESTGKSITKIRKSEISNLINKCVSYYLNEGSNESIVTLFELKKTLEPFGWTFTHSNGGDNLKMTKGKYVNVGHLLHGNRTDERRRIAIPFLFRLKKMLIDEFYETHDLSTIKAIPWEKWNINSSPLNKELKDFDPETGLPIEKEEEPIELGFGQKMALKKIEKAIEKANETYKDATLWPINNETNSAYIMLFYDDSGIIYNTCRSQDDRRPLLKKWTIDRYFKKVGNKYFFGKENMRKFVVEYYEVLNDGTLAKEETLELQESKKVLKNYQKMW